MANSTPPVRGWAFLQQMEDAYVKGDYNKVGALSNMASAYFALPTGQDIVGVSATFSSAAVPALPLQLAFTLNTITGGTVPANGEAAWAFADGSLGVVTNKALTSNVATLTVPGHNVLAGQYINVLGVGAPFDGTGILVTVVTPTTISFAKTNADITSVASTGGSIVVSGLNPTHSFPANGQYFVSVTLSHLALPPVTYGRYVSVPFGV